LRIRRQRLTVQVGERNPARTRGRARPAGDFGAKDHELERECVKTWLTCRGCAATSASRARDEGLGATPSGVEFGGPLRGRTSVMPREGFRRRERISTLPSRRPQRSSAAPQQASRCAPCGERKNAHRRDGRPRKRYSTANGAGPAAWRANGGA